MKSQVGLNFHNSCIKHPEVKRNKLKIVRQKIKIFKIGYQICEGNSFGDSCTYECEDGYNLMGNSVSTCGKEGWDNTIPQCVPADCPERDIIRYGFLKCTKRGKIRCTYECEDGYTLFPPEFPTITCKSNHKWSRDSAPNCQPISCTELPPESNGQVSCSQDYKFGTICSLICNSGHKVKGTEERLFYSSCGVKDGEPAWKHSNGTIIETHPVCEAQQCQSFLDENVNRGGEVKCSNGMFFNSKCDIECNSGMRKVGNSELVCEVHNDIMSWSGKLPKCEPIQCLEPPILQDGKFDCEGVEWGNQCKEKL